MNGLVNLIKRLLLAAVPLFAMPVVTVPLAAELTVIERQGFGVELREMYSNRAGNLFDGNMDTRITMKQGHPLRVSWTEDADIRGIYIRWYAAPSSLTVIRYGPDRTKLTTQKAPAVLRRQYIEAGEGCCSIEFTSREGDYAVSELSVVHSDAALPFSSPRPCDTIVFVPAPGEEYSLYGGLLPRLVHAGREVMVVYMCSAEPALEEECLVALEALGITNEPVFLRLTVREPRDTAKLVETWKSALSKHPISSLLSESAPTLIIAPDGNDETFSRFAQATGLMVAEGFKKAGLAKGTDFYRVTSKAEKEEEIADWKADGAYDAAKDLYSNLKSLHYRHDLPASQTGFLSENGLALLSPVTGWSPEYSSGIESAQKKASEASPHIDAVSNGISEERNPEEFFFRQPDEPEEIVLADEENGHWEYRSDYLSVIVDRHLDETVPLAWCTAHIRMRGESSFRSVISSAISNESRLRAWRIARRTKAVLLITGDNLVTSEKKKKGLLIRNGTYYTDFRAEYAMMFGDDLGMTILDPGSADGQLLADNGVKDVFSFGPVLLREGEIQFGRIERHRVANNGNPRCGIGMIEPGHLVAIVVDGRQKGYSLGVDLREFAKMFLDEGCMDAYNLDGGGSTAMVFMGENLNVHGGMSWDNQRYLPEALLWGWSRLVPSENAPINNIGNGWGNLKDLRY
ncbi:MAG: phosphodiester glycosidase family protein [Clostridiales bacterium]|nr:phosphodiester glycosidase family protein [Clostridiales bacterium]